MIEGIYPAEFVLALHNREHVAEGYIHLTGYVSPESTQGRTRLYVDPDLSAWIEVADEDIRYVVAPPEGQPDWPTRLWVRRSAEVTCGTAPTVVRRDLIDLVNDIAGEVASGFKAQRVLMQHRRE